MKGPIVSLSLHRALEFILFEHGLYGILKERVAVGVSVDLAELFQKGGLHYCRFNDYYIIY